MEEKRISDNASCFLIKDERLKKDWHLTPIYDFLQQEGFSGANVGTNLGCRDGIDWLYVNIYSKVFAYFTFCSVCVILNSEVTYRLLYR